MELSQDNWTEMQVFHVALEAYYAGIRRARHPAGTLTQASFTADLLAIDSDDFDVLPLGRSIRFERKPAA